MIFILRDERQAEANKYDLSSEARVEASAKAKEAAIVWPKENESLWSMGAIACRASLRAWKVGRHD